MTWSKRSEELEIIDLGPPHFTEDEYMVCLDMLDKVGEYLGGDRASFTAFRKLSFTPSTILDVGCGGGGFTRKLAQRYPKTLVKGIDISDLAIQHAKSQTRTKNIEFDRCYLEQLPSSSFDVVIATLVCHHFKDEALIPFLNECLRVSKKKVIINDLHRHPIAFGFYSLMAPVLFRNRLITHDGCLSIKRGFSKKDWQDYLSQLKCQGEISWHFPFRWMITLEAS